MAYTVQGATTNDIKHNDSQRNDTLQKGLTSDI